MKTEQTKELKQRLAEMNGRQRKELGIQAAERRVSAQKRSGTPEAKWSIEQFMLYILRAQERSSECLVVASHGTRCHVESGGEAVEVRVHHSVGCVVPGDRVVLDGNCIREVLPRATSLERGIAPRQVIVANIDVVVVVVSCVNPPLHPKLIDRYLAAIWKGGAEPAVVLNKTDLHADAQGLQSDLSKLSAYQDMGIPVVCASADQRHGLDELRDILAGRLSVFVGHSGVGKSSLVNALLQAAAGIGAVSHGTDRGTHTTTSSALYERVGVRVIDTPGIREFGVEFESPAEVAECFRDFPAGCRFSDCMHVHEDDCAVLDAVSKGALARTRYDSYRRLLGDAFPEAIHPPDRGFVCRNCGVDVSGVPDGTKHRNHCPACLHSVHLDHVPGDRLAACGGTMDPVAVWVRKGGEWAVIHRCRKCGHFGSNRIAADDNELLLMSLAVRPLSAPPFPLEHLAS